MSTGWGFAPRSFVIRRCRAASFLPYLTAIFQKPSGSWPIRTICAYFLCGTIRLSMIELLVILCLVLTGILAWTLYQQNRKPAQAEPALTLIQQEMNALREQLSANLSQNTGTINQRLDNAARLYGELRDQLGQLSAANAQIQAMVKDVSSLQDILRPPKLRGGMGEVLLENLLREILPAEHFSMQHRFRNGFIVDAVIRLKEGLVPVDAKFPLENFRRMLG